MGACFAGVGFSAVAKDSCWKLLLQTSCQMHAKYIYVQQVAAAAKQRRGSDGGGGSNKSQRMLAKQFAASLSLSLSFA